MEKLTVEELKTLIRTKADYLKKYEWKLISKNKNVIKLPVNFIWDYVDFFDWSEITNNNKLSVEFIREFNEYVDWMLLLHQSNLKTALFREFNHINKMNL